MRIVLIVLHSGSYDSIWELGTACSGELGGDRYIIHWGVEVEIGRVEELGTACSGEIGGDRESGGTRYSMLWGDRWR